MSRLPTMLEILREQHGLKAEGSSYERSERLPLLLALLAFVILLAFTL